MKAKKKWSKKKKLIMSLSGAGVLGAGAVAGATVGALQAVRLKPSASEIKRVSDLTMSYFQKWKDGTFDGNNSVPRELSEEQQMIEDAIVKGVSENDTFEIFNENKRGWHRKGNDFLKIKNLKNINIYSNLEDWLVGNKADGYDVPGGWTYNKLQVGIPGNLNKMEIIVNLYNDEELTFYVPVEQAQPLIETCFSNEHQMEPLPMIVFALANSRLDLLNIKITQADGTLVLKLEIPNKNIMIGIEKTDITRTKLQYSKTFCYQKYNKSADEDRIFEILSF